MLTEYQESARLHTIAASAINAFALDFYPRLSSHQGNLFFSPFSIYEALGLAYAGASGQTAEQMAAVLRWPIDQRDTPPSAQAGVADDAAMELISANAAWAQRGVPFLPPYRARITGPYRGAFFEVDFARAPEQVRDYINLWVQEKTSGKIRDLLPQNCLSEADRLVLTNAVYLDARWDAPFPPSETNIMDFHLVTGGMVRVPMMHIRAKFMAVEEDRFAMVQLPYSGYRASMQIYLPHEPADLFWLEKLLLATGPDHWQGEMSRHLVTLSLPRFRLDASFKLRDALRGLGMPDAFDAASADFSAMAARGDPGANALFFLSEVIHKTFLEVDEVGTRAAAATATTLTGGAAPSDPPPLTVNVDHPFLLTICANSPRYRAPTLLFMGRVMDPSN
jgi:serpin B